MTLYGFPSANAYDEPAWFHTVGAAKRFREACGWSQQMVIHAIDTDLMDVDPRDIMDTETQPWEKTK